MICGVNLVDELVEEEDADTDDHIGHQHSQGGHQLDQHGCGCGDWELGTSTAA